MVVLSVAICTKSGKALVSRQYVDVTRGRIEGLMAAFPKLMGTEKQHTYIETESVRYVYQPLESLYLLLITNKISNILEDLDTLHLLAKKIPDHCRVLEEDEVSQKAFDLIFMFDEVISLGYREKVTPQQIQLFLEMDSHEEKIHEMVERNKLREAKEEAKRRQHQIERERAEKQKMGGMGGGPGAPGNFYNPSAASSQTPAPFVVKEQRQEPAKAEPAGPKKGMQLGKVKKDVDFLKKLAQDDPTAAEPVVSKAQPAAAAPKECVNITVEEKLVITVGADSGLQSMEVKGDLAVYISDPTFSKANIIVTPDTTGKFQIQAHPKINKALFAQEHVLALKDPPHAFPAGSSLRLLKWRAQTKDESWIPFTVNCWPNVESDGTTVNIEYQLNAAHKFTLRDVTITIPLPVAAATVSQIDGEYRIDPKSSLFEWSLPLVDSSNASGSLEFIVPFNGDTSAFFPIQIHFVSNDTLCPIEVEAINSIENNQPVKFSMHKTLEVEQYEITP
eukprot:TRINITY_DN1787_c0_g1_i1.p1 TRINITY_DN1787_c0_g1~~TRINITY_DN1787_c0_g1_i1.p1  ORF type:complete len:505 (+),score=139.55 TRINITY_DN1787_c0_g1_i1:145-1659(+)